MRLQEKYTQGFSLIELISVIVLLSILGVLAMSRLSGLSDYNVKVFYDELVSAVRYAQKLAVSTGCDVQITITSSGYALHQRQVECTIGDFTRPVLDPTDRSVHYQGSTVAASITPPITLVFGPESRVENLASDATLSVGDHQLTVYRNTGLVDGQ